MITCTGGGGREKPLTGLPLVARRLERLLQRLCAALLGLSELRRRAVGALPGGLTRVGGDGAGGSEDGSWKPLRSGWKLLLPPRDTPFAPKPPNQL
jgi:hypothetical protein